MVDQPSKNFKGTLTQNGLFYDAAMEAKSNLRPPELVQVYEKLFPGTWVFNGAFDLMDAYQEHDGNRNVFKFVLQFSKKAADAEDPNYPLHAGRSHLDSKYDIWLKKNITEIVNITFSTRYRTRQTDSEYDWVKDLKSFEQMQFWLTLKWDMIYDKY